jgi:SPP1 gp7 family putative phage head morphogenesis protein
MRLAHFVHDGCACVFADGRRDPTGTSGITKKFEVDVVRRFRKLAALITQSIVTNNALGLGKPILGDINKPTGALVQITRDAALDPGRFEFSRSSEKVSGFMGWLREQEKEGILGVMQGTPIEAAAETAWTNVYIASAYRKGVRDAGDKLRRDGAKVAPSWTQNAFTRPLHADRSGLAFSRTFSQLEGITDAMDQQISRILAQGLAEGRHPFVLARQINEQVKRIGIVRARMLARTEVINAHAEATLNSYQEAGIQGVEVESELLITAGACEECEGIAAGGPYTIDEARGLIPAHPNCRCAWTPKVINGTGIELT